MYALVTGASAGIGLEIAKYLAEKGYDLIITARRGSLLRKLRRQIRLRHPQRKVIVITADLSKREECMRLYREACRRAGDGNIDFVVNNAGMGVYGPFLVTDLEKELTLIDLNVTSVHILSKLFLRDLARNGHKNYVVRLTEAIHEELRRAGSPVKVSCLCPGPVATAFNDNAGVKESGKQITAAQAARIGVEGALQGKMLVIPGRKMQAVVIGSHLLGEHLSTRINYLVQRKKAGK